MVILVEDVMNKKVVTIEHSLSARYAARIMDYLRISSLVVTADDSVVGILTERDLVSKVVAKSKDSEKVYVKDVMSMPVITISPNMPLDRAIQVMIFNGIKKLPVMAGKNNMELVGIISLTDIARLHPILYSRVTELQHQIPQVREAATDYIH